MRKQRLVDIGEESYFRLRYIAIKEHIHQKNYLSSLVLEKLNKDFPEYFNLNLTEIKDYLKNMKNENIPTDR